MHHDRPRARQPRRRWLVYGLAALAVLAALRLAAPRVVAAILEARLSAALGAAVTVEDVDLALWAGELTVHGLRAAPRGADSASAVRVREVRARWTWGELFHGATAFDVTLSGVAASLDLGAPWPADSAAADEDAGLGPLRALRLDDGALDVVLAADEAPLLALRELTATLDGAAPDARDGSMTARFAVAARVGEAGSLALAGAFSPLEPGAAWSLRGSLDALDLRSLNPLFRAVLELDVEQGRLSAEGELTASLGRLRGQVRPNFEGLRLLGRDERSVRHPMAEALFTSMLAASELPIDIDRSTTAARGLTLDEVFKADANALLTRLILQGYTRRLGTIVGHDAAIGGLEVDFPAGRLSFTDVSLVPEGAAEPFVHVARMDVVVEPTAVDAGAETYKSVVLTEPRVVFVAGVTERLRAFDPQWQEKVSGMPYPTDRLQIVGGRVEYRDTRTTPPADVVLTDVTLLAESLGRARATPARRDATLSARASMMGTSPLKLELAFSPGAAPLDGELDLSLAPMPLTRLNGLLRSRLGVDFSAGTLGLVAELDAKDGRVTGTVTPDLDAVTVLGRRETEVDRPLRELLVERRLRRLDGDRLVIELDSEGELSRELPRALLSAALQAR